MSPYYSSITLTVLANIGYHLCQKSIRPGVNPLASLAITYALALLLTVTSFAFLYPNEKLLPCLASVNWASYLLGGAIVGLELGFLLAYRAGWNLTTGALFSNLAVTLLLIPIGIIFFKESVSVANWVGIALSLGGLLLMSQK